MAMKEVGSSTLEMGTHNVAALAAAEAGLSASRSSRSADTGANGVKRRHLLRGARMRAMAEAVGAEEMLCQEGILCELRF